QHNAWVHALATVGVTILGFVFGISPGDWCWIVVVVVGVWTAEALNTAFEFLCDVASPEYHPTVKHAKDVAAGAVLLAAIGAAIVGCIIFVHRILLLLQ
ncbi:MAG: diacylglycerol kinase family protein, partial [Verrucomicrobiae bacterium]|nr:diacylglycerol kinase family protein [Verrucomicrobiae bacterium]